MKALAIIAIGLACAGCASADQRARRNAATMAQMTAEDDAYCKSYGVEKDSPKYVECRNKLTEIRVANGIVAQQNQAEAARSLPRAQPRPVTTTNCIPTATGVSCK